MKPYTHWPRRLAKRLLHAGLPLPRFLRPAIAGLYRAGVWTAEGSSLLYKLLWVEPVLRSICESVGTGLRAERLPYIRGHGVLTLGSNVNLSGRSTIFFAGHAVERPRLTIGNDVFVGNRCTFSLAREITIGDGCLIASGVRIHDNDGHPLDAERRRRGEKIGPAEVAPVTIGANVWVGAGATILKGVTIGENAVVGTGAIVTRDVASNTVVAGNPGRAVGAL